MERDGGICIGQAGVGASGWGGVVTVGGAGCAGGLAVVFLVMRGRCGVLCDLKLVWLHRAQGSVVFDGRYSCGGRVFGSSRARRAG